MQANSFILTLEDSKMISPNVKHFIFKKNDAIPLTFEPGQFITIHFEHNEKMLKRSYSLANPPSGNATIEFAAGFIESGPGTDFLFKLKPGDSVEATGPFGRLTLKEIDPPRYILIATSTGITPYRSMLPKLEQHINDNPTLRLVLIQGVQTRADLLYNQEFENFMKKYDRVSYFACLSREESSLLQNEHKGYVQHILSKLSLSNTEDMIYLCGNPSMVDDTFSLLQEQGFTVQRIIREKYISR